MTANGADGPVLCGVDPSDEAAQAARFAAELAVRAGARLILLHAAPPPWAPTGNADQHELMQDAAAFDRAGYLGAVVDPISVNPLASVERVVEFGLPVEVMRSVAEELRALCLVVGSRGEGAVEAALAGSTTGALAREAPCPVVLVPAGSPGLARRSARRADRLRRRRVRRVDRRGPTRR